MVRHGQTGPQIFAVLVSLSTSAPLAETKACGTASTGEVSAHERTTASRSPRVTRHGDIATLLDPVRMTGLSTPEGAWPRDAREGVPRTAVGEQRAREG